MSDIQTEILTPEEFQKAYHHVQVADQKNLPTQMGIEANIMRFPLVSFKGDTRKVRVWKKEVIDSDGQVETFQELKFFAPGNMELANGLIDRKIQILSFHLWRKFGSQENGIFWFTLRGIAEFLHIAPNGKNLKKIKEAICRLRSTLIVSTNAITKKTDEGVTKKSSEGYLSFFSKLQFIFSSNSHDEDEHAKNLSFAQIDPFFINNFMRQYCGTIDLPLTLKLKQPASLGLYLMLCSHHVSENNEFLFSLKTLIDDIPLDPTKSKVVEYDRLLNQSFKELISHGVLEKASKKEKLKGTLKGERKIERIFYLLRISTVVKDLQLSLFPETPKYDDSFQIDPILSQMISLSGLDIETAKKIISSKEFEMDAFQDALEVTIHNSMHSKKDIKNPESYIKTLLQRGASLSENDKKKLQNTLLKSPEATSEQELFEESLRPIPNTPEELVEYLIHLGMWQNEAKNICKNQPVEKIRRQINGWLIKHENENLADNIKELASACKSEKGYESFNNTPYPQSEAKEAPYQIKGYHKSIWFRSLQEAKAFCAQNNVDPNNIYQEK